MLRSAGPNTTSAMSPTRVLVDLDRRDLLRRFGAGVGADEQRLVLVRHLPGRRIEGDAAEGCGQVVDGEAARGQRIGVDDDADQRLAVAADLDVGHALDRGEAVDDLVVDQRGQAPRSACVGEVTESRMIASELVSALTMVGASESSGQVAERADGVAEVVGRGVEVGGGIELDGDPALAGAALGELIDTTPGVRDTAPSITAVISLSMVSGVAPL